VKEPDTEIVVSKWYYALEIAEKSHVIVGIHQEDERQESTLLRRPYIDMGVALLRRHVMDGTSFVEHRDLQIGRDLELETVLEPGSYLIVPRTSGCNIKRPSEAVDPEGVQLQDEQGSLSQIFSSTLQDVFKKFDLLITNSLDFKEFADFLNVIGKQKLASEIEFKN